MINRKLKGWLLIAISEIIISMTLMAVAPTFLNSKKPVVGFLIWFTVPTMLASSSIYAVGKLGAAHKARQIFITAFPEYSDLNVSEFLDLSPDQVASQIALLTSVKENEEIQELNISLLEILEQTKNEKN